MGMALSPNSGFDQPGNTVIMQSRLNSMTDEADLGPTSF
jgi:hypothetical protein